MALRSLILSTKPSRQIALLRTIFIHPDSHFQSPIVSEKTVYLKIEPLSRFFSSGSSDIKKNFKTNFSLPSVSESDDEGISTSSGSSTKLATKEVEKPKLPPPYDPFNKTPVIEEPEDPRNLQEIFHNMRSDGLMQSAVKMFDGLSKQGLTHEALQLFSEIKEKGNMPDVIAHTAVIEAYANAGQSKEAHKVYLRMLAAGVMPNAYTYTVLIKGLVKDKKKLGDARKYLLEMTGKGIRPNEVYAALVEGLVREGMENECESFVEQMKSRGYVADEKCVREALSSNRGPVFRAVMGICFGK